MNWYTRNGGALFLGSLLVVGLLFSDLTAGLAAVTETAASLAYFVVLPTGVFLTGLYTAFGGPYSAVPVFLSGSYLGFFGVALTFGTAVAADPVWQLLLIGLLLSALSVVSLVGSLLQSTAALQTVSGTL
ncbi:MAG: hypothetical protein ABEI99_04175, partial [Halobaculum sp.]